MRVVRGMIGTGLTFAVGIGAVTTAVGAFAWLRGRASVVEVLRVAGRFSVASFLLGVAFAGVLALTARGRRFNKLSLPLVGSLGAGAGFLYWLFLASTGGRAWSPRLAIINFGLLTVMGAGSAIATLLIARRARSGARLASADDLHSLGVGDEEIAPIRRRSKADIPGP
ncbi:MAG TPA: hypothetical protein VGQ44_20660 [Gemmatimonadaceae bacterium]|nr:hypothetical protein [Gemmatimonadaceae bacterium]